MGCDCYIYLPDNARLKDVCEVIGALVGLEKKWVESDRGSRWVEVKGVKAENSGSTPEMCVITGEVPDGPAKISRGENGANFMGYWHWEGNPGYHLLSVKSTSFWITIGKKLVDFFGGYVDFNDCDDKDNNYTKKVKSDKENSPEDGAAWSKFQERIMAIKPLTTAEFNANIKHAAYEV